MYGRSHIFLNIKIFQVITKYR